jgi:hypothetical protein
MASYSNSSYSNSFYDLTGIYFNSTIQSASSSSIDLDVLDARYFIKSSGGTISNNLIVFGSVDIQTSSTIPNIRNVEDALDGKQVVISDGDLSITKTDGSNSINRIIYCFKYSRYLNQARPDYNFNGFRM